MISIPVIKVHRGADAVAQIRESWEHLQHHPNSDFEHYLLVCQLRREVIQPWAFSIWDGGHCRAVVAARLERIRLSPRFGYCQLPGVQATVLNLLYEGIMGELDDEESESLVVSLTDVLSRGEADMVSIHSLSKRFSGFWGALGRRPALTLGAVRPVWTMHHALKMEKEPGFLVRDMRSKHRSWIKRKEREIEQAFDGIRQWKWHQEIADLAGLCELIEGVAKTTYQRGLGAGFLDGNETRQRLALFARRGQMRVFQLEIDGVPKAFWLGEVYQSVFHSSATGYTPDMRSFEVGTLVFLRMVDELVREGVERLDFGLGDAQYKERFGNQFWYEANAQLFGSTSKSQWLRAWLGSAAVLDRALRTAATRIGILGWVKQWWRERLRG